MELEDSPPPQLLMIHWPPLAWLVLILMMTLLLQMMMILVWLVTLLLELVSVMTVMVVEQTLDLDQVMMVGCWT